MSTGTVIEWTEATWNPVAGCTRVSAGCDNCYAVKMTHRLEKMGQAKYAGLTVLNPKGDRHFNGVVRCVDEALSMPLEWKKSRRIVVNSMSDLFHERVPFDFVDRVFAVMALCPQHTFQVLTKRPERMAEYVNSNRPRETALLQLAHSIGTDFEQKTPSSRLNRPWGNVCAPWPLYNVWLGTSCEDQAAADERIPHLLRCPAAVRFLSCEPLLGPVSITHIKLLDSADGDVDCYPFFGAITRDHGASTNVGHIGWVIAGGESGPGSRPCDVDALALLVGQCRDAGCPVFVKQLGRCPYAKNFNSMDWPDDTITEADGAHAASAFIKLRSAKGGDMEEWPEELRVRELPQ